MDLLTKYLKYLKEVYRPIKKPSWTTTNKIRLELSNVILRDFSVSKNDNPILILAPQAGHHSNIADYCKGQSLVEAALSSGKESVYVTEWKSATPERKNETIDDFIQATKECVKVIGKKVNLIGLCQGGWQATIYAALYPEDVNSMVLAAAPIDFHAGNNLLKLTTQLYPMKLFEYLVNIGGGNMDGRFMVIGFKMMNPFERFVKDYLDLYNNIENKGYVERYQRFRDWYEYTQMLPGKFYLQVVKDLFKENKLVKGELKVLNSYVNLSNITHPLTLIAGERDDITAKEQLFNIEKYVNSSSIKKLTVPAGHIGVFMSRNIIKNYWPDVFKSLP